MEWGATSILSTTIIPLQTTLFPSRLLGNTVSKPPGPALLESAQDDLGQEVVISARFAEWAKFHGKEYPPDELRQRALNFNRFLERFPGDGRPNGLADLSESEFERFYRSCGSATSGTHRRLDFPSAQLDFSDTLLAQLPTSINWTAKGAVTPVKLRRE